MRVPVVLDPVRAQTGTGDLARGRVRRLGVSHRDVEAVVVDPVERARRAERGKPRPVEVGDGEAAGLGRHGQYPVSLLEIAIVTMRQLAHAAVYGAQSARQREGPDRVIALKLPPRIRDLADVLELVPPPPLDGLASNDGVHADRHALN